MKNYLVLASYSIGRRMFKTMQCDYIWFQKSKSKVRVNQEEKHKDI